VCNYRQDALTPYAIQALLILLAPILFAATVYMFLGRLIRKTRGERYSIIRSTWLTKIFVGGDIACFLIQALGAGILTNADTAKEVKRGEKIILGGLIFQILVVILFMVVAIIFQNRLRAQPKSESFETRFDWKRYMTLLYIVSTLITVRNIFRVIEYAGGGMSLFSLR